MSEFLAKLKISSGGGWFQIANPECVLFPVQHELQSASFADLPKKFPLEFHMDVYLCQG
jgi:hypothetical protein